MATTNITYHFEIHKRLNRKGEVFFWSRIKSSNRKIVWHSEAYTTKQNAEIPVKKLIQLIGKRKCSLLFFDHTG